MFRFASSSCSEALVPRDGALRGVVEAIKRNTIRRESEWRARAARPPARAADGGRRERTQLLSTHRGSDALSDCTVSVGSAAGVYTCPHLPLDSRASGGATVEKMRRRSRRRARRPAKGQTPSLGRSSRTRGRCLPRRGCARRPFAPRGTARAAGRRLRTGDTSAARGRD